MKEHSIAAFGQGWQRHNLILTERSGRKQYQMLLYNIINKSSGSSKSFWWYWILPLLLAERSWMKIISSEWIKMTLMEFSWALETSTFMEQSHILNSKSFPYIEVMYHFELLDLKIGSPPIVLSVVRLPYTYSKTCILI